MTPRMFTLILGMSDSAITVGEAATFLPLLTFACSAELRFRADGPRRRF